MSAPRFMLVGLFLIASNAPAELAQIEDNGWHTWRVAAAQEAPAWCCEVWQQGKAYVTGCDLDRRQIGYVANDDIAVSAGQVQIYAHMRDGQPTRIRTYAADCPVSARARILDLGSVESGASVRWLEEKLEPRSVISAHAIAAISVHGGQEALDVLLDVAVNNTALKNRKDALFWMGQARAGETEAEIKRLMFTDANAKLREHAAFSLSQSNAPGRIEALVKLGQEDRDGEVRSQAWFWLAQSEAAAAEVPIQTAIIDDKDARVREQAIFALSQLPGERATKALAVVIENRQLDLSDRKHALFWLAQLESDAALAYIDRLLSGN